MTPRPTVVVVSHTHWDREWYQPFEVFRLRLGHTVAALLDILDRDPGFRHFMLDGQTVCLDDVVALAPALAPRLGAHVATGRLGVGPWYVLQDEFLVGAEAIVRNLGEGLESARRWGGAVRIGYLPDAFGHIAQMPRILRGFGIDTAVVWRGVGAAPGSEWRWRAPGSAEVLCLFLPGGYGNAHRLGGERDPALARLDADLATVLPLSRAGVLLWMNGNDHQPAERELPALLGALAAARPDVDIEHATLTRAAALVRARVDEAALPVVTGELRRATPTVPVLSGTWSARTWQKRRHDDAQALVVRLAEPFTALAARWWSPLPSSSNDVRAALAHAWRLLLQCQPHDSICGCSVDEVHRDIDARLGRVAQLGRALVDEAVQALAGAATADFALHGAIAVVNPHPFTVTALTEVALQRALDDAPFRVVGPGGEVPYEIVARTPTDGPDGRPAEWLRVRLYLRDLLPHGLRLLALEPGVPLPFPVPATTLALRPIAGGLEIVDGPSGARVIHTFEDEGDRGDLYDFCPRAEAPPRSSRDADLGVRWRARALGRRVEIDVDIDNRAPDHRLRARFDVAPALPSLWTDTAFGWLERREAGTHPVSAITVTGGVTGGAAPVAVGGHGLHEIERAADGAVLLTIFRAVGWMSRGDLSTRRGHAGYNVPTPDAQGLGRLHYRYTLAFGDEAVREVEAGLLAPYAVALGRAQPSERAFLSVEPAGVRLSILKRAASGDAFIVRLFGPPDAAVVARLRLFRPLARVSWSDLDERPGPELPIGGAGDEVTVPIAANEVVTLRIE